IYTEIVRKEAAKIPTQIKFRDQFLSRSDFKAVYQQSAALIINSYRQMALGNIFTALQTGTKIYLSEKNITYYWLKKNRFMISSIEKDLRKDISQNDLFLSATQASQNFNNYIALANSYTPSDF